MRESKYKLKSVQFKLLPEDYFKVKLTMKKNGYKTWYDLLDHFIQKGKL